MRARDLRPTRLELALTSARALVAEWADQNPLGQVGLGAMRAGLGERVAEMTGAEQYNILQVRCHPYFPVTGYPNFSILQNNGKLAFQVRRLVLVSPLTY